MEVAVTLDPGKLSFQTFYNLLRRFAAQGKTSTQRLVIFDCRNYTQYCRSHLRGAICTDGLNIYQFLNNIFESIAPTLLASTAITFVIYGLEEAEDVRGKFQDPFTKAIEASIGNKKWRFGTMNDLLKRPLEANRFVCSWLLVKCAYSYFYDRCPYLCVSIDSIERFFVECNRENSASVVKLEGNCVSRSSGCNIVSDETEDEAYCVSDNAIGAGGYSVLAIDTLESILRAAYSNVLFLQKTESYTGRKTRSYHGKDTDTSEIHSPPTGHFHFNVDKTEETRRGRMEKERNPLLSIEHETTDETERNIFLTHAVSDNDFSLIIANQDNQDEEESRICRKLDNSGEQAQQNRESCDHTKTETPESEISASPVVFKDPACLFNTRSLVQSIASAFMPYPSLILTRPAGNIYAGSMVHYLSASMRKGLDITLVVDMTGRLMNTFSLETWNSNNHDCVGSKGTRFHCDRCCGHSAKSGRCGSADGWVSSCTGDENSSCMDNCSSFCATVAPNECSDTPLLSISLFKPKKGDFDKDKALLTQERLSFIATIICDHLLDMDMITEPEFSKDNHTELPHVVGVCRGQERPTTSDLETETESRCATQDCLFRKSDETSSTNSSPANCCTSKVSYPKTESTDHCKSPLWNGRRRPKNVLIVGDHDGMDDRDVITVLCAIWMRLASCSLAAAHILISRQLSLACREDCENIKHAIHLDKEQIILLTETK